MVNGFTILVTMRTSCRVREPFSSKSIGCPTFLMCYSPHEKSALARGPAMPNPLPRAKRMAPVKRASYADFIEKVPMVENCQICVSSKSGWSSKFPRKSHSCKYSKMTSTVWAPFKSETYLLLSSALKTVLPLPLAVTNRNRCGKVCSRLCPAIHLSVQKRTCLPFPTTDTTAAAKKALTWCWALTGRNAHALPGSVFCNHGHLILRTQPKKLKMGKTQSSQKAWFSDLRPCNQTMAIPHLFSTFPQKTPSYLINCLKSLRRKVEGQQQVDHHRSKDKLNHNTSTSFG